MPDTARRSAVRRRGSASGHGGPGRLSRLGRASRLLGLVGARGRPVAWALAGLLAVPAVVLTLARPMATFVDTPAVQLAAATPWAAPLWLLVLTALAAVRSWRLLAVPAVLLLLHAWWLSAAVTSSAASPAGGTQVRVLSVNAELGGADADAIAREVRARGVDVLAVQELTAPLAARLGNRLGRQLPHADLHPAPEGSGAGLWSRWPLRPAGGVPSRSYAVPRAVLQVPGAGPVTVTVVHTTSPQPGQVPAWRSDLAAVDHLARATGGRQILAGDFNSSRDHPGLQTVLAGGFVDAQDVRDPWPWSGLTWPARDWGVPLFVRIDHVLVSPDSIGVRDVRVVPVPGTDHRGLLAVLAVHR